MSFDPADYIIIVLYFAIVQIVGFVLTSKRRRHQTGGVDYLLAGRRLTLPLFVATLVATWYGSILGIGEFVYSSGIVAWICFGVPYYIAAVVFAVFLAERIRKLTALTIPEQLTNAYGAKAGIAGSALVLTLTLPASYILTLGILVQLVTGWSLWLCIAIGAALSIAYVYRGGFRAGVYTDVVQCILMYVGFALLLAFSIHSYGSPGELAQVLPESHLNPTGGYSWQYIAVWFVIAFQTLVDPGFHQRSAATRTPQTARKGVFVAVGLWALFDGMTLLCGLYAKAYILAEQPLMAYPLLSDAVLPTALKGLFFVSLAATVMSTLDSATFISGVTIGRDLLMPLVLRRNAHADDKAVERYTRIGILITAVLCIAIAIALPSVVEILYLSASIGAPGIIFPVLLSFRSRPLLRAGSAVRIMSAGSLTSLVWVIATRLPAGALDPALSAVLSSVEPMFPGLLIAGILTAFSIDRT